MKQHKRTKLENKIKQLEVQHKTTRSRNILVELKETKNALDTLITYKAEGALRYSNQSYFEMGNRASHLLAFQLRKAQASCVVNRIIHPVLNKFLK